MDFREHLNKPLYCRRDGTPYPFGHEGLMEWAKDHAGEKVVEIQDGRSGMGEH
jgi:hypothetical protein